MGHRKRRYLISTWWKCKYSKPLLMTFQILTTYCVTSFPMYQTCVNINDECDRFEMTNGDFTK